MLLHSKITLPQLEDSLTAMTSSSSGCTCQKKHFEKPSNKFSELYNYCSFNIYFSHMSAINTCSRFDPSQSTILGQKGHQSVPNYLHLSLTPLFQNPISYWYNICSPHKSILSHMSFLSRFFFSRLIFVGKQPEAF